MRKVKVEICGTKPILFHAFKVEKISSLTKVKSGSAGNDPDEWRHTVLEKGNKLYIPASYFLGSLKEGSKYTKAGRGSIQKSFMSSIDILTDISFLDRELPEGWKDLPTPEFTTDSSQLVYLDIRGVMNPNSKGKNIRYRVACCPGWKTNYEFEFDDNIVSKSQVKKIVEDTEKMVGIGDGRVLGYGRYKIESCEIE